MKREEEANAPTQEERSKPIGFTTLLLGGGVIAVIGVILAVWYFFFQKKGDSALPSLPERSSPPEEVDSDKYKMNFWEQIAILVLASLLVRIIWVFLFPPFSLPLPYE